MAEQRDIDPDKQYGVWYLIMTNLVFEILKENDGKAISGDTLAAKFRANEVPPHFARKGIPLLVKGFKAQGYIKRTGRYVISSRSGKPLPTYQVLKVSA